MQANEVIEAIHGSYAKGSKHGLRNVRMLLELLCPERRVPVIHVAGTNGKGSVCAMLESILRHAGYRTGLYTSPFLQAYPERIRLDGLPLSDELLVRYGEPLLKAAAILEKQDVQPTPFELGTALALSVFEGERVDAAIVEVGLGGRLDPTNVVSPCLCAITAIGMDHMDFLGNTLEEIAGEKAGIIKPGVPVVCHPAEPGVAEVFACAAQRAGAPLIQLNREQVLHAQTDAHGATACFHLGKVWDDLFIPLPGDHQLNNALTVLGLLEQLQDQEWRISENAVREGLRRVRWPARLEWCGNILIDGAHNPQGVAALSAFVREHLLQRRRVLLTGVLADKLQPDMLRDLCGLAEETITVTPDNPRAMCAQELAQRMNEAGGHARASDTLEEGLALAREAAGEQGIIIAAGSLYFAGSLRSLLGLPWRDEA